MNANKLFSDFSLKKIWDKLLQHDKAMNSTLLILSSGNWLEQADGTYKITVPYSTFKETDKLTVDLYDDGTVSETLMNEYEECIDSFEIINGALIAIANTKPTQTITIVVKGEFETKEINISDMLRRLSEVESNFTMAADAIGDALVAKELIVPEGSSLFDMADIINNSNSLSPKVTIYYQVDQGEHYSEKFPKGELILYPSSFTPTKEGWEFIGWRKDSVASKEVLANEVASASITLFAVFKKSVTISFNGNNSTSGGNENLTEDAYYNSGNAVDATFTLPSPGFNRTDYGFTKWALSGVNGVQYAVGDIVTHSTNATYFALWEIKRQTGSFRTSSMRGGTDYVASITFPVIFDRTPTVTTTYYEVANQTTASVSVSSVTKTGCTIKVHSNGWSGGSNAFVVTWTATVT